MLADWTFGQVLWELLIIFAWVIWFWLLITVFADLFRRRDIGGGAKVLWCIFVIILPFLGVFIYLLVEHDGMAERTAADAAAQAQTDAYIEDVAGSGGAAAEIEKAKGLLDSGAISRPSSTRSSRRRSAQPEIASADTSAESSERRPFGVAAQFSSNWTY